MRKPIRIKVCGKFKTFYRLTNAARFFKVPSAVVRRRLSMGWSTRKALTTPLHDRKPNKYKPSPTMLAHMASEAKPVSSAIH